MKELFAEHLHVADQKELFADLILTNGMAYKYMPFFGSQNRIVLNENGDPN